MQGCGASDSQLRDAALDRFEYILASQSHPSDTAAVLVEPIQGEGGINVPPAGFLPELSRLCKQHDILLIMDEIQSGAGRTGEWRIGHCMTLDCHLLLRRETMSLHALLSLGYHVRVCQC